MKRILSLDGGGVRGALSARILQKMEESFPYIRKVDLLTGTSTGGIIALCLASGMHVSSIVELYLEHTSEIFKGRPLRFGGWRAKYDNKALKSILIKYLGDITMMELNRKVLIPTFDLSSELRVNGVPRWGARFFHNFEDSRDMHWKVVDVAMATAAAPVFLPTYLGFADGGLAANNPTMCAVAKLLKEGTPLQKIEALSIGAGVYPKSIEGDRHDWGIVRWGTKIIQAFMDASATTVDYHCRQILGRNYLRVDIPMRYAVGIDDHGSVPDIVHIAAEHPIDNYIRWCMRSASPTKI